MIVRWQRNVKLLEPIAQSWEEHTKNNSFGLECYAPRLLQDLQVLVNKKNCDLFVLMKDEKPVGFLGMTTFTHAIGHDKIANEHYWYVLPEYRSVESVRMLKKAKEWAVEKGCSHLMLNASNLASGLHDRICKLYDRMGFVKIETTYIQRI